MRHDMDMQQRAGWVFGTMFALAILFVQFFPVAAHADPVGDWNSSYGYRQRITVTNSSSSTLNSGYSSSFTIDHAALVAAGKSLSSGADVRVAYWNASSWTELDRALDLSSAWESTSTKIWFQNQANISASSTDPNYYLYYGNSFASVPSYASQTVATTTVNSTYTTIKNKVDNVLYLTHGTFSHDSTDFWKAAPTYVYPYVADSWYAFSGYPDYFTATQIKEFFQNIIDVKDGSGNFPLYLLTNGTVGSYYSGCDTTHAYVTGDGAFFIPQMEKLYYDKSGDITAFSNTAAALKTALANVPRDGTTKLVNIPAGSPWVTWGFHDGIKNTGNDLMGSLLYYQAAKDMSSLYTAAGDSVNAAFFTSEANDIQNNISVLWNASDGMFHSATIQNDQIDILGSAYAVFIGITGSASSTAISNYLVDNYATITSGGFVRQSPTNWAYSWGGDQCGRGVGNYDDGYWPVGNEWVATALALTNESQAIQLITDFANNADMSMEYYGASLNGATNNLPSAMGALHYASDKDIFPDATTNVTTADYSNVFTLWDDFSSLSSGWTSAVGMWGIDGGVLHQTVTTANEDPKLTYDAGLANNVLMQGDMKVVSYTSGDHASLGMCVNSVDTGLPATARGYCSALRGNDTTKAWILNAEIAYGTGTSFTWTTGSWYRTQIARIGTTIYRKTWAVGNTEPANWQETYTQSNNLTATGVSVLGGYSTADFDNVIVRPFVVGEPSTSAGSETAVDATAPVLSSGSPSGEQASGTTQATLSLSTDENAQCKYGTAADTAYASIANSFSSTSTSHSVTVSGLSDGTSYDYYVRCQDGAANTNTSDYTISFSVASPAPVDSTAPVLSGGSPSGEQAAGTTEVTLEVTTDEAATCKYGTTANTAYASIANSFTGSSTSHTATASGLSNGTSYTYYARCQDGSSNANTSDYSISFSVASPPSSSSGGGGGGGAPPQPKVPTSGWQIHSRPTAQGAIRLSFNYGEDIKFMRISDWYNGNPATQVSATSTLEWPQPKFGVLYIQFCTGLYQCTEYFPQVVSPVEKVGAPIAYQFSRDLTSKTVGVDVLELQKYLNAKGFILAPSGFGSPGNETSYFGSLTRAALIRFQEANAIGILNPVGLTKGTGYFGPSTRAFILGNR